MKRKQPLRGKWKGCNLFCINFNHLLWYCEPNRQTLCIWQTKCHGASLHLTSGPAITLLLHYLKLSPTSSCLVLETCNHHPYPYWPFFVLIESVNLLQLTFSIFNNAPPSPPVRQKYTTPSGVEMCYFSCPNFSATYQTDSPPPSGQPLILKRQENGMQRHCCVLRVG